MTTWLFYYDSEILFYFIVRQFIDLWVNMIHLTLIHFFTQLALAMASYLNKWLFLYVLLKSTFNIKVEIS